MPVVIDEITSNFDIRDEAKLREFVRSEVKKAIAEEKQNGPGAGGGGDDSDVTDRRSTPEP
jgi:hypothetical protein